MRYFVVTSVCLFLSYFVNAQQNKHLQLIPATKGERKERPNTTKKVEQIKLTATAKKKSGVKKAAKERPAYDFSAKRQEIKAKRATRTSNVKFDREAIQQKIKERRSKQ